MLPTISTLYLVGVTHSVDVEIIVLIKPKGFTVLQMYRGMAFQQYDKATMSYNLYNSKFELRSAFTLEARNTLEMRAVEKTKQRPLISKKAHFT